MDQNPEKPDFSQAGDSSARRYRPTVPDPMTPLDDDSVTVARASKRPTAHLDDETVARAESARVESALAESGGVSGEEHAIESLEDVGDSGTLNGDDDNSEITVVSRKPPHSVHGNPATSRQLGELLLGKQLGTFKLDSFLGSGGMGAVFQATDIQLHRQVAVKVLKSTDGDADAVRRFRTEAQSAARLDHENIARVYHVGQDQGWNFIVLELVAGKTLRQLVAESGPLSFEQALDFFQQLSSALQHAHHRQIIHRDIKPSNVLLTPDLKVKLVDMGLARIVSSERQPDETEDGMTLGTFDYIAPEQARDPKSADQQSDLYSLGCTLFYALTGRPPFAGGNAIEKILNHNSAPRPNVCDVRPDLPAAANLLITRLMAPNKIDRIASADELGEALKYLQQPKVLPSTSLDQQPVGVRIPILLVIAATVVFVLTSLFDQSVVTSDVVFPKVPGLEEVIAAPSTSNSKVGNSSDSTSNTDSDQRNSSESVMLADGKGVGKSNLESYEFNPQPWLLGGSNGVLENDSAWSGWSPTSGLRDWGVGGLSPKSVPVSKDDSVGVMAPKKNSETTSPSSEGRNAVAPNKMDLQPKRTDRDVPNEELLAQTTTIQVRPQQRRTFSTPISSPRPNTVVYGSLSDAIGSLDRLFNVHTIELCFDGEQNCEPVEIDSTVLRTIKAGDGYRPAVRFVGDAKKTVSGLITVTNGSLEISGIDWIIENSTDRRIQVFDFPKLVQLSVSDCSFTMVSQRFSQPESCWVDANTSQLVSGLRQSQAIVSFNNCVLRGDANLLRMDHFSAIGISLVNVWMVSSSPIFRFGSVPEDSMEPSAEIDIQKSSLISSKGLAVCDATGKRKHGQLLVHAKRSLLAIDGNDGLFRHVGKVQWKPIATPLYFDGSENKLAVSTVWTIESDADFLNRSYTIDSAAGQSWFKQKDMIETSDGLFFGSGERNQVGAITGMSSQMDWAFLPGSVASRQAGVQEVGADSSNLPAFPSDPDRKTP